MNQDMSRVWLISDNWVLSQLTASQLISVRQHLIAGCQPKPNPNCATFRGGSWPLPRRIADDQQHQNRQDRMLPQVGRSEQYVSWSKHGIWDGVIPQLRIFRHMNPYSWLDDRPPMWAIYPPLVLNMARGTYDKSPDPPTARGSTSEKRLQSACGKTWCEKGGGPSLSWCLEPAGPRFWRATAGLKTGVWS